MNSRLSMSSKLPMTDPQYLIDQIVIYEFERVSGLEADWGTLIDAELKLSRAEKAEVVEACFLRLLPEYEWTAPDMTLLQSQDTVEEWIQVFERIFDYQDSFKPTFTFNFNQG